MDHYSLRPRLIIVLIVVFVLGTVISAGPSLSTSAQAADPPTPTAAPRDGGLHPISPSSPLFGHTIDPRPLHDRQQRQAGLAAAPQAKSLPSGLLDRLQQTTSRSAPKIPRADGASLAQTSSGCRQWIYDPGLTDTNGNGTLEKTDEDPSGAKANWYTDIVTATIEKTIFTSAPNAVRLQDGDETVDATDVDMISQDLQFNSADTDFSLQFRLYQTVNDPGYDSLYYGLATFNGPTLDKFLYWNVVPDQTPGTWNTIYDRIDDPTLIQLLKDKDADPVGSGVWLVFFNITDGLEPFTGSIIDDVYAETCASSGAVSGTVQTAGAPVSVDLLLGYGTSSGTLEVVKSTTSLSDGSYSFSGLRPLAGDGSDWYQVYYVNDGTATTQVSMWSGPFTTKAANDKTITLSTFDLSNVALDSPADDAKTTLPITFSWTDRGLTGEGYYFCLYDPDTFATGCSPRQSTLSYQVTLSNLQGITGLNFQYDHRYAWYVVVEAADGDALKQDFNYGFSFYERGVTVTEVAPPALPTPPDPSGQTPSGGTGQDWTVMAYIAGDNNLGDLVRYPNAEANLQGQFATLKQLATSYPKVNFVTLTDFYDGSGTQLCQLKSDSTQNCQQLGEKDTSDPAVLTDFINTAMDRFPATHTMLIIADHGNTMSGMAVDETTSQTAIMDPGEIRQAFQNSRLATTKADVIFYSACLMGSFESAYNAAPFANYLVASSDELWVLSVYERMLPFLSGSSKDDPRAVAAGIVDAYKRSVQATANSMYISSAAYDLSKITVVNNAISQLGVAISDGLNSTQNELIRSTLNRIRNNVQVYDSSGNNLLDPSEDALVDLRHLTTLLSDIPDSGNGGTVAELSAIKTAATGVLTAIGPVGDTASSFVIASQQISGGNGEGGAHDLRNATGLSLFMPNGNVDAMGKGQQRAMSNLYLNGTIYTPLNSATQWDDGLRLYTGFSNGSASPASGPGRFVSGTLPPVAGAVPSTVVTYTYLPVIRR